MKFLLSVFAALVVFLGITSTNLWHALQSSRQQIVGLQGQLDQANTSVARLSRAPASSPMIPATPAPAVVAQPPAPPPPSAPRPVMAPPPVVSASVHQPLTTGTAEERHADALVKSDRTASARVLAWSSLLDLSPEQLQALNETAKTELRRETEESLQIDSSTGTMDAEAAAQLQIDTINRQHATNLRILDKMTPQLTPEQASRMRTMFEAWVRTHLATARAMQGQNANSGY